MGCTSGPEILDSWLFHGVASEGRWGDVIAELYEILQLGMQERGVSTVEPKALCFLGKKADT